MKALVTGATGFLGFHVTRRLLRSGHEVRAFVRPSSIRRGLDDVGEICVGDIEDAAAVSHAVAGCDVVFHLAGRASFWNGDAGLMWRQHVVGTSHVAEACRESRARLVYTSSVAALGPPQPDGSIGDETSSFSWGGLRNPYAAAKHEAGRRIAAAVRMGLDAVTVLPATTFGPYDFNYSVARMIENIDAGLIFIYPPGGITVAHADAVAEGHLRAAQLGRTGARYVLGGEHLTFRDLFARIARRLGRRPPWLPVPPRALRILGAGGSLASTLARRDLGLTSTSARLSCLHLYYDSAKAIHELGYEPRSADDALTQACCWYRDGANARAA